MTEKAITKISLIINSILFITVGFIIIFYKTKYLDLFHLINSLLIIGLGGISLILNILKTKRIKDILLSLSTLGIGIFFYNNKRKFLSLFPIMFGIYMLVNGIIKFVTYVVFKKVENENFYNVLLGSVIDFIFSYIMIKEPSENIDNLTIILGIYIILFGVTYAKDFLKEIFPDIMRKKRKKRITLPIIVSSMMPYGVLLKINNALNSYETPVKVKNKKVSGNMDLEIFIHVKDTAIGRFGHADLCYKGMVYSYGCYDEKSKKLFESLGNGTLFKTSERDKYLKFCTTNSDKTIFAFGITLTDKEKEKIEKRLKEIEDDTYSWNPKESEKNSYAQKLVKKTQAKFYKFKNSNYKTYFLMSTNCVKLVDDVVGTTGSDLLTINGVITPGAYYEYLENEFKKKNSNVITKQIYSKEKKAIK